MIIFQGTAWCPDTPLVFENEEPQRVRATAVPGGIVTIRDRADRKVEVLGKAEITQISQNEVRVIGRARSLQRRDNLEPGTVLAPEDVTVAWSFKNVVIEFGELPK